MAGSPIDELQNASPGAKNMAKLVHDINVDLGMSDLEANKTGAQAATTYMNLQSMLGSVVSFGTQAATPVLLAFLQAIATIREQLSPVMAPIAATVLSEFLGTPIDVSLTNVGTGGAENLRVSKAIGEAIYTQLLTEFGPGQPIQPGDGERAAKIFSGYSVNFAIQNAILGTIMDGASLHVLEQFRDIGVDVARGLGLGRLQRLALGTLLTQVMQKPYTADLAAKYRPDRLSDLQYVHAFNRGGISSDQVRTELQRKGYRDPDIEQLIIELETDNTATELEGLVRWGKLTQDEATAQLVRQGMTPTVAAKQIQALWTLRADGEVSTYANALGVLLASGQMDPDIYSSLMAPLPLTDDEKYYRKLAAGLKLEFRAKQLTWTEVVTAFENGVIDVDYVQQWLQQAGYGPDEQIIKFYLLAIKEATFADKQAAAQAKADKLKAASPGAISGTTTTTPAS